MLDLDETLVRSINKQTNLCDFKVEVYNLFYKGK